MRDLQVTLALWTVSGLGADAFGTRYIDDVPLRRPVYLTETEGREWEVADNRGIRNSQCPGIMSDIPNVVADSFSLTADGTHAAAASGVADFAVRLADHPGVEAIEYYILDAHMAVAWWKDGGWMVPIYWFERAFDEVESIVAEIYRQALVDKLNANGVGFTSPKFDLFWAGDASHREPQD